MKIPTEKEIASYRSTQATAKVNAFDLLGEAYSKLGEVGQCAAEADRETRIISGGKSGKFSTVMHTAEALQTLVLDLQERVRQLEF